MLEVLVMDVALAHLGLIPAHLDVLLSQARSHSHLIIIQFNTRKGINTNLDK